MVRERFKELLRRCEQCGACTASCPGSVPGEFNIRRLVRHVQLDLHRDKEFLSRLPWLCTLCHRCRELCTEGLEIPGLVRALRELALRDGLAPESVRKALETIKKENSPFVSRSRTKTSWLKPETREKVVAAAGEAAVLFWVGCTPGIMVPRIPQATAVVLEKFEVSFKVLETEPCCGEPLIALGLLREAKENASRVVEAVRNAGVGRLVTACSGCANALKKLYPEVLGVELPEVELLHLSELLESKLESRDPEAGSALKLEKPMRVAYHDPCSLGRHCGIYEAPRKVLEAIEGVTLVELTPGRELATCCGGGGGLWAVSQETAMSIAAAKVERELLPLDADALVTSCPLCLLNFRRALAKAKARTKVLDLVEVVAQATTRSRA